MRSSSTGGGDVSLDDRAVGDPARRRHALRHDFRLSRRVESGHGDGALRAGVDLAVGAGELGQQQRAAHQRGGVAERGDGDVETLAGVHAGRQCPR